MISGFICFKVWTFQEWIVYWKCIWWSSGCSIWMAHSSPSVSFQLTPEMTCNFTFFGHELYPEAHEGFTSKPSPTNWHPSSLVGSAATFELRETSRSMPNGSVILVPSLLRIAATRNFLWISAPQTLFNCFSISISNNGQISIIKCSISHSRSKTHSCMR